MTQMYDMFYDAAASNEKTGARSTSKWTKTTGTFGEATASNAGIGWDTSPTMGMSYAYAQQARWQCPWATRELIPRSGAHPSPPRPVRLSASPEASGALIVPAPRRVAPGPTGRRRRVPRRHPRTLRLAAGDCKRK